MLPNPNDERRIYDEVDDRHYPRPIPVEPAETPPKSAGPQEEWPDNEQSQAS